MSSLISSASAPSMKGASTGLSIPPKATVQGLPDRLYEIVTRLKEVDGLPDNLHTMTPEQTEVAAGIIASFVSREEILALLGDDQESEDEPQDWGSYNWKYWGDPRNAWSELPSGGQTAIQHGANTLATFIGSIYVHTGLKKAVLRRRLARMRETKAANSARGTNEGTAGTVPSIESPLARVKRNAEERFEVISDIAALAGRRTGDPSLFGKISPGRSSKGATSTEK